MPLTVLVVDDDPIIVRIAQMTFESEGYKVQIARDGEEGLRKARDGRPDAILLDIMMPKLDGLSVTRALKHDVQTASIPIILCSAKSSQADEQIGVEAGADAYITKPFHIDALAACVRALVGAAA
jgi:two-component system alkaline phosphatase synthesis response regulator PhoP